MYLVIIIAFIYSYYNISHGYQIIHIISVVIFISEFTGNEKLRKETSERKKKNKIVVKVYR